MNIKQMKKIGFLLFSLFLTGSMTAQEFNLISVGKGYNQQAFFDLNTGDTTQSLLTAWDIAFSTDPLSGGVLINEGSSTTTTDPKPEFKAFVTSSTEFVNIDTSGKERIYNNEVSWGAGAFNSIADPDDNLDYGWGKYNVNNHKVVGNRVFVVQMRNGDYKKLFIDSLVSGTYYFRYADLNGDNQQSFSVAKSDYQGQTLAYFSFSKNAMVNDIEPETWDLLFTRYTRPLDAGGGQYIQYMVTGVLSGTGVKVAQADGINPDEVGYVEYKSQLSDTLNIIGHDWKAFNLQNFEWVIADDRAYFVKTPENEVYKVIFIDFEGSSTGVTTVKKELITETTSTVEGSHSISEFTIFPNPTVKRINFSVDVKSGKQIAYLKIHTISGNQVFNTPIELNGGFNVKTLSLDLPAGMYILNLQLQNETISRKLQIQ